MEIVTSIVGKIVELTLEPLGRQLSYLCLVTDNIQKLKSNIEMLRETRETVQRMVDDAKRNAEDIKDGVQNWLDKVDAMIVKSEEILTNGGQQNRFCLNLVQRHQLSRKAVKMVVEVLGMKNEGNFDKVSRSFRVAEYDNLLTRTSDFLLFESRRSIKEIIIRKLVDDNIRKVGIYGMGGVGKSTIVKEILREVMEKKLFDEVVVSTISQTPNLERIQKELAEKLGLTFTEDTVKGRELKLHKRLMTEKRSLIVLDDIWAPIDLEMIGIPSDVENKGCKILFASRNSHTLSNNMSIDEIIEIKVLQEDEAWLLFKKNVGATIDDILELKAIAVEIVKKCANLPIAIVTVAKALRNKSILIWEDVLNQLRDSKGMNITGMKDEVYGPLKLSYDLLESETKMLFLLCSMFPEDFEIDLKSLHIYAMAFDILHGVDIVAKRRKRIAKLVDDLISSSLLQNCEYGVKMHDLLRDVAISIASEDDQIRTLSYVKNLNEWDANEVTSNHTAVYIKFNMGQISPVKLMLPKIKLLILEGDVLYPRTELSVNFFEEMKELKVLVLKEMKFSLWPPSLHSFKNVRSLHLIRCELENIDMIGELNQLEILSFQESNITKIPMAMSQLTQLKVLDLSSCFELEVIPPNVLSKLIKLEELKVKTYNGWEVEELNKKREHASIFELKNLTSLSTLCLRIKDENVMSRQIFPTGFKLENFNISIGSPKVFIHFPNEIIRKELYLNMESECCMNDGIKTLLRRSEKLHLEGSFGANVFLSILDDQNESLHVKHLDLLNICGLQHIIHSQKQPFGKVLSNLMHLCLKGLGDLVCMVHGYDRKSPFNKLKFIKVERCKKLVGLFLNCIVEDLSNLETIEISGCEVMEVVAMMENETAINKFEFTHLKTLFLWGLPQLIKFSSKIEKCRTSNFSNNSDSFFDEEVSLPKLEELTIGDIDNLKMICGSTLFSNSFSKLKKILIFYCKNLEKVFSRRIMRVLTCLESISIKNCNLLEEIFEAQESNVIKERIDLLPQLKMLRLSNLPNLRYVWSDDPCELLAFENMETLSILQCPKLTKGCVINALRLPQLKHLKTNLSQMEVIYEKERSIETSELQQLNTFKVESLQSQDGRELFSKLKFLEMDDCLNYRTTNLSMEFLYQLPRLEYFAVNNALIEEIFSSERLIRMKEHQCTTFDHLKNLNLTRLPKLKHLWKEGSQNSTLVPLRHLKFLSLKECGVLNILVPSSASFRNLKILKVVRCDRLTHLLNPSVAKTLVQLETICIQECKRMNTLIDDGGVEDRNDEIVFNKLLRFQLVCLPNLTSFHSGKCIIKFPCLGSGDIDNCPEMKVFSLGSVSTPHLHPRAICISNNGQGFYPKDSNEIIVDDINAIIQQNWEENFDSSIQDLFAQKNLEENDQSHHSSSHVEEQ